MNSIYLITGATGNVGSEVVAQLLGSGASARVLTRDPSKVASWAGRVEVVAGDYGDLGAFKEAVNGVDGVFLINQGADVNPFRNSSPPSKLKAVPGSYSSPPSSRLTLTRQSGGSTRPRKTPSGHPACPVSFCDPVDS